jgi:hypothetical protein
MRTAVDAILITGFLFVDWLTFHDLLKVGEVFTFKDYLVGLLSLLVFVVAAQSLLQTRSPARKF